MPKHKIQLPASKSISNRLLVINALAGNKIKIKNLSAANDTAILSQILTAHLSRPASQIEEINCEDAGTAMRFLSAFFATQKGQWLLRGTDRMHQRPIKILVDKLKELGADIKYLGNEGCPPLLISGCVLQGKKISIDASISSQFISAILMVAPYLSNGLEIELTGTVASKPYIEMTLGLMQQCGISAVFEGSLITIKKGNYIAQEIEVENDWSAASYWYALTALSEDLEIELAGLLHNSLQGDNVVASWMEDFGVRTTYTGGVTALSKAQKQATFFEKDFSNCPDLAPTFICLCAAMGVEARFYGIESLAIKESDRTQALATELEKLGVKFIKNDNYWELHPNSSLKEIATSVKFDTYGDHRLAMAFAMFKLVLPNVEINTPEVVKKSYPTFWADFESIFSHP